MRTKMIAGAVGLVLVSQAYAQPTAVAPKNVDAFEILYGMSYYNFDWCGDQLAGSAYRQAVKEKFESCPFSREERTRFSNWTVEQRRKADQAINEFIVQHGATPDHLDGMKMSCKEHAATTAYISLRELLTRYSRAEVPVEAVIPEPCDGKDSRQ